MGSSPLLVSFPGVQYNLFCVSANLLRLLYTGCDVSRLSDFIVDFCRRNAPSQNVDDAYCAFVWSMVVQQPEVRVGTAPEGAPEVYIAPQHKIGYKKFKGKGKGKGDDDEEEGATEASLHLIPDAASKPLDELKAEYGDALRIAVDPQRSFVAITGSHIRVYAHPFVIRGLIY